MSKIADINAPNQKAQEKVDYIIDKKAREWAMTTKLPADREGAWRVIYDTQVLRPHHHAGLTLPSRKPHWYDPLILPALYSIWFLSLAGAIACLIIFLGAIR